MDKLTLKYVWGVQVEMPLRDYCRFTHSILFHGPSTGEAGRLKNSLSFEFEVEIQFYQLDVLM